MIDVLQTLLNERKHYLIALLVTRAGFARVQASTFLSPALAMIVEGLRNSGVGLKALLERAEPWELVEQIDGLSVAREAGVPEPLARLGVRTILPEVLSFLEERIGGPQEIHAYLAPRPGNGSSRDPALLRRLRGGRPRVRK